MNFDRLDEAQINVVRWTPNESNMRVVAAAGSGKTTTVTALTAKLVLVDGVAPHEICVLTFANKAAAELSSRINEALGAGVGAQVKVGTYHAVGLDFLRKAEPNSWPMPRCMDLGTASRDPGVPSTTQLYRSVLVFGTVHGTDEDSLRVADTPERHIQLIQLQRADGRNVTQAQPSREVKELVTAWAMAERAKQVLNAWEFDDVLLSWEMHLRNHPEGLYRVVIVDEAQDNNRIQGLIALALAGTRGRVVMVGDLRQTVHEWRGAYPKLFAEADKKLKAQTRELPYNYRSRPAIIELCNQYAHGMPWSLGSPVSATREPTSDPVVYSEYFDHYMQGVSIAQRIKEEMEAGKVCSRAVLCRTNGLLATMEAAFVAVGVPVHMPSNASVFRGLPASQAVEYLRAVCKGDASAAAVIANVPKRFIPRNFLTSLVNEPARPGETLGRKIARLATQGNWARGVKKSLYDFSHFFDNAESCTWRDQIEEVRKVLRVTQDDAGEAHETDNWAVVQAVLSVAARCENFDQLDTFIQTIGRTPHNVQEGVVLSTIHRAKGLEWDEVYVDVTEGMLPHHRARGPRLGEEQRLLYVALSRARERLHLSAALETYTPTKAGGRSSLLNAVRHLIVTGGDGDGGDGEGDGDDNAQLTPAEEG